MENEIKKLLFFDLVEFVTIPKKTELIEFL